MAVKHRYVLTLNTVFWLVSFGLFGQIESMSDAPIPCDKVFAIDGDVAIGADYLVHYRTLKTFNLGTGAILSSIDKVVYKSLEVDGVWYFLLLDVLMTQGGDIYAFQEGELSVVNYSEPVLDLLSVSGLNQLLAVTESGFVVIDDGQVITEIVLDSELLNMVPRGSQFLGLTEGSYYSFNADFSISESFEIPSGLKSFDGAILNDVLLLTGEVEEDKERPLTLLNTANGELMSVSDSSGSQARPLSFATPKGHSGNHFFIAGCGQIAVSQFNYTHPTEAGFIDHETGIYTPSNFRPGLWQDVVQPIAIASSGGLLVFGRMGMEGIEPYAIEGTRIEPVADLYPGWGGSIDLLVANTANYIGGSQFTPDAFEVVVKDGVAYFAARSPLLGLQVWRSDGTAEGTYAITRENVYNKGCDRCAIGLSQGELLLTALDRAGARILYRIDENAQAVYTETDHTRNWEISYSKNPTYFGGVTYFESDHPKVHLAQDGSSLLVLKKTEMWYGTVSLNHKWVMPGEKIQGFYARTFIQTLNPDGSLRSSASIRAREDQERTVGRSYLHGRTYALVSHRPADTWVNERQLMEPREGHHIIELDDQGTEIKSTFLPTGGKDRFEIAQVEVSADGIYVLGMADRNFTFGGAYSNTIAQGYVRAVLMKFDLDHNLLWVSDSGLDQDIFGSGLQSLVVGKDFVYMASGGTSYSVWSSCAYSEWPYQISSFRTDSGVRQWTRQISANDVTRITNLELVGGEWLWIGGYTRGDLSTGSEQLFIQPNYVQCSYNGFLLCIQAHENSVSYFSHSDPTRAKFIQDLRFYEDHLYALSLVYEKDPFPMPIYGVNGRWNVQFDKLTNGGVKVDSLVWPTAISTWDLSERLQENKFSFDFHPDGGIVLAVDQLLNGRIDGFYSPPSSPGYTSFNSWLIQRRDIVPLVSATLPPSAVSLNEFRIYPNPVFSDAFVLELPKEDVEQYDRLIMTDINGRVVSSRNLNGSSSSRFISVDTGLANGLYLIQLEGSRRSDVKKLVLQR